MKSIVSVLVLVVLFQGCASIEEGEVDYVRTIANKATDARTNAKCSANLYPISEYSKAGFTRECYETLYRKYTKVAEIKEGDTISVHLMQAFNGFADENRTPSEFLRGVGSNAEMVVIANVCEQGVSGCSLRYGPESDKVGRVIYYSNGVKAKQYLNFSYLPVYGPIKYQGGPLILQISILELDFLSEQQKNLLSTLAQAGKKAYPPASEALSVLDRVGASLMAGSADDIIFRYTMSLVPFSTKNNYQSPIVAEGNYAFIRKNTWSGALEKDVVDELKFDNLTGRLVKKCNEKDQSLGYESCTHDLNTGVRYKDYRENTYLTFQIKSGFSEATLDNIQSFNALLTEINAESDAGALEAIEAIANLEKEISRNSQQNLLLKKIDDIKKLLANIHDDTFGLYDSYVFQLADAYNSQIANYITTLTCSSTPKSGCELLMTPEQLLKVQLELRSLLQDINPAAPVATEIPSGYTKLGGGFSKEFVKGYQLHYNEYVFQRYLADIEALRTIITTINFSKEKGRNIKSSQALLKEQVAQFLRMFAKDLALKTTLSCSTINLKCYRYLTDSQVDQVTTIFNQIAETDGMSSSDGLGKTPKTAEQNITILNSLSSLK